MTKNRNTLYVVGTGSGDALSLTFEADAVLRQADIIVGYRTYIKLLREYFPDKEYLESGMRDEISRCETALSLAADGKKVAVVCSGDSGVYGMAGLLYELWEKNGYGERVRIKPVSGVTAALSGGALLGAPLSNDFAVISLSDRLTDFLTIEKRLYAVAAADLCAVLYNPKSKERPLHLKKACDIFLEYRSAETVCGIADKIGRDGECATTLSLYELSARAADVSDEGISMQTTIFIGNSETKNIDGKMVTLRGYHKKYE